MASYGMNDVKNGMKIIVDGYPCTIIDTDYVKPGKGQAFTRVKYRNLKTARVVEMKMRNPDGVRVRPIEIFLSHSMNSRRRTIQQNRPLRGFQPICRASSF